MTAKPRWRGLQLIGLLMSIGLSTAAAQDKQNTLPSPEQCSALIGSAGVPLTDGFRAAVQGTVGGYMTQNSAFFARSDTAEPPSADAQKKFEQSLNAQRTYLRRLLGASGWLGADRVGPELTKQLIVLLLTTNDADLGWCAGQVALRAADLHERQGGARLVDGALLSKTGEQRYGTVYWRSLVGRQITLPPIADAEAVDARRTEVGLEPLADMLAQAQTEQPVRTLPKGLSRPVKLNKVCQPFTSVAALNRVLSVKELDRMNEEADDLVERDQAARRGDPNAEDMMAIDATSAAWLKDVLKTSGWPSTDRADPRLSFAAWLLVQHADMTPSLQACALDLLGQQLSTPDERRNFAYLTDRVRLSQGDPQVYGTQVTYDTVQNKASPRTLVDPANVNQRRAAVGLEPLEDYLKGFERPRR